MGSGCGEWGVGVGSGCGEWVWGVGVGSGEWGVGSREWGVGCEGGGREVGGVEWGAWGGDGVVSQRWGPGRARGKQGQVAFAATLAYMYTLAPSALLTRTHSFFYNLTPRF